MYLKNKFNKTKIYNSTCYLGQNLMRKTFILLRSFPLNITLLKISEVTINTPRNHLIKAIKKS